MGDKKRYTVIETNGVKRTTVVSGNVVRAYKQAIDSLYGDRPLSEVPREINLEIKKVEERKQQWVEIDG